MLMRIFMPNKEDHNLTCSVSKGVGGIIEEEEKEKFGKLSGKLGSIIILVFSSLPTPN